MEKQIIEGPKDHIKVSEKEQTLEDNRNNIIWLVLAVSLCLL